MLQLSELTLEDIFLKITMGEGIVIPKEEEKPQPEDNNNGGEK